MVMVRIDDAQVRDAITGELIQGLVGQPVKIVARDTSTAFPIFDSIGDPIPGSVVTVTPTFTVPRIWIDVTSPADVYLDWLDEGSGARGPVDFDRALRDAASSSAAAAASSSSAASSSAASAATTADEVQTLRRWVELGVTRRNFALNPRAISGGSAWSLSANGLTATQTFLTGLTTAIPGVTTATRFTVTAVTSDSSMFLVPQATVTGTGTTVPVLPGQRVSAGMLAWASWGAGGVRVYIQFRAADSAILASTNSGLIPVSSTGGGTWVTHTAVAPEGSVYATVLVGTNTDRTEAVGDWIQGTAAISAVDDVVTLATADWFDGTIKPTTNKGYRWSGPENASVSEMIDMSAISSDLVAAAQAAQAAAEDATKNVVRTVNNVSPDASGNVTVAGGGGVTDHGALSGLGDDDHPQYLNNTRGDARYYTKGQVDTLANNAASANSAADRNRANHTGTQPISSVAGLQAVLDSLGGTAVNSVAGKTGDVVLVSADISDTGATGREVMGATTQAAGRTALGAAASSHTHTSSQISDSTSVGRGVLTAASASAARSLLGAGTSDLTLGTTADTAMRGNAIVINPASTTGLPDGTLIARTA